jgi:hypothetical protein
MKQLREQIKKEIIKLMEEKYPLPQEIEHALKFKLKLDPIIRYISNAKAAATIPPSYEIYLHNGTSFLIIYEEYSLKVKIEAKEYYLGDSEELALAKSHLNRLLTQSIIPSNSEGGEKEKEGEDSEFEEPEAEEPAEEEPEA